MLFLRIALPILIIIIIDGTLNSWSYEKDLPFRLIFSIMFIVGWELALKPFLKHNIKQTIKEMKKDGKLAYEPSAEIEITDDALIETSEGKSVTIKKSDIVKIVDVEEYLFVYFGAQQAVIIPKRCIVGIENEVKAYLTL